MTTPSFEPEMVEGDDLVVNSLGTACIDSPLGEMLGHRQRSVHYVEQSDRVLLDDTLSAAPARGAKYTSIP